MIEKNRETNTYYAVCDCCYEYSCEYNSFHECEHGIKEEGWKQHYNKSEDEWELSARIARRNEHGRPDEKIKQHIPQDELLAQLAEECAELSQAALKLRRALTGINPTPVTVEEARKNLVEETADVYNVMGLLLDAADNAEIYSIIRRKKERWLKRLEG